MLCHRVKRITILILKLTFTLCTIDASRVDMTLGVDVQSFVTRKLQIALRTAEALLEDAIGHRHHSRLRTPLTSNQSKFLITKFCETQLVEAMDLVGLLVIHNSIFYVP